MYDTRCPSISVRIEGVVISAIQIRNTLREGHFTEDLELVVMDQNLGNFAVTDDCTIEIRETGRRTWEKTNAGSLIHMLRERCIQEGGYMEGRHLEDEDFEEPIEETEEEVDEIETGAEARSDEASLDVPDETEGAILDGDIEPVVDAAKKVKLAKKAAPAKKIAIKKVKKDDEA